MPTLADKLPRYRSNSIVFSLLCLLAVVMIMAFIIIPAQREMREINGRIHAQREALEFLYTQGQSFRLAAREYDQVKNDVPLLEGSFFLLGEELQAITIFEGIAARAGVEQSITLDTSQNAQVDKRVPTPYRRVILRLDMAGTFSQLLEVLREIESLPQQVNVLSLGLDSDSRELPPLKESGPQHASAMHETTGKRLRIAITASTYWKDKPAQTEAH